MLWNRGHQSGEQPIFLEAAPVLESNSCTIQKKFGITWHCETIDKPHPIRAHAHDGPKNYKEIMLKYKADC